MHEMFVRMKIMALLLLLVSAEAVAQDDAVYMNILKKDGTMLQIPASEIQEVRIVKIPVVGSRVIGFSVDASAITSDETGTDGSAKSPRKTKETVLSTFPGFYLFAFTDDDNWTTIANGLQYTISDDNGVWSVSGDGSAEWPYDDDQMVNFFAIGSEVNDLASQLTENNGTGMFNSKNPYAHVVVTEDAEKHDDILVAKAVKSYNTAKVPDEEGGDTYREGKSVVHLKFYHVSAGLQFSLKSTLDTDYEVQVQNVVLKNVINNGDYYFNTDQWTVPEATSANCSDYTLTSATDHNEVVLPNDGTAIRFGDLNSDEDYLFMVPQSRSTWETTQSKDEADQACKFYVMVNCKIKNRYTSEYVFGSDSAYDQLYFRIEPTWEKNKIYPYVININNKVRTVDENGHFKKVFN